MKGIEQPIKAGKTTTEQVMEFVNKKEQSKDSKNNLPKVDTKYQELCNIGYVQDGKARTELMELIDELSKFPELKLVKTSGHDLSIRYRGRQVAKVCPKKKSWSASINGGKIQTYTKDMILRGVDEALKKAPQIEKKVADNLMTDNNVIQLLERRIEKMDKTSKGIHIKGLKMTDGIKKWVKQNGYSLSGETLLVNRVE